MEVPAAAPQGLQAVRRMFDHSLCRMRYDLGDDCAPWSVAYFGGVQLDGIDVYRDEGIGGRRVVRDRIDISENPADEFLLAMPFSARIEFAQAGRVSRCEPGEAMLFATDTPFASVIAAPRRGARYSQFLSRISASALRARLPELPHTHLVLDMHRDAGRRIRALCDLVLHDGRELPAAQREALSALLLDAIAEAATASMQVRARPAAPEQYESSQQRLRCRALTYIESRLGDATLDVPMIAHHCAVSERYLHAVFAAVGQRIGAQIRELRLQHCRSELRSPASRAYAVLDIALRWGFSDAAHFSRIYKQRFGCSPRAERQRALGD